MEIFAGPDFILINPRSKERKGEKRAQKKHLCLSQPKNF